MNFAVLPLLLFAALNLNSAFADDSCEGSLRIVSPSQVRSLRAEIQFASDSYGHRHPSPYSLLRGFESTALPVHPSGHMIYLASGADIYRPLYDFPLIQHYHLVDLMTGQRGTPQDMIDQIVLRFMDLAPKVEVTRVDPGFLDQLSEEILNQNFSGRDARELINGVVGEQGAIKPLVLKVNWVSPGAGPQEKFFYFHALDMHNSIYMKRLLDTIPANEPLVGVLEAGYSALPTSEGFHALMDRLSPDGHFIFEHMLPIGFSASKAIEDARNEIGPAYTIQLNLPDGETQEEMAANDHLKERRIFFEYLFKKPTP